MEWMSNTLSRISTDLVTYQDGRQLGIEQLETYEWSIELVYRELIAMEALNNAHPDPGTLITIVQAALNTVRDLITSCQRRDATGYRAPLLVNGYVGRPSFLIPRNQLCNLLVLRFHVPQITTILGVSVRTIRRRMTDYGLSVRSFYTNISDSDLECVA